VAKARETDTRAEELAALAVEGDLLALQREQRWVCAHADDQERQAFLDTFPERLQALRQQKLALQVGGE
jgi:16S rRNA U516 pseudouridylate synthase RsuA-like enzyme